MPHPLADCIVRSRKITHYLLDVTSLDGAPKAKFFMSFGFLPADPDTLAAALKAHASTNPIAASWADVWGKHWNVIGPLRTPIGSNPIVLTAWVKDSDAPPRLVTAIPA